jgi:Cu-Zn family superoxide dismutase
MNLNIPKIEGHNEAITIAVAVVVGLLAAFPVFAADAVVTMNLVNEQGVGKSIGTITISEGPKGLVFTPKLTDLAPGPG